MGEDATKTRNDIEQMKSIRRDLQFNSDTIEYFVFYLRTIIQPFQSIQIPDWIDKEQIIV